MIRIEFTEEAIEKLRYERFHHPHPRVQRKMEALLLKSDGLPHHRITRILGTSENTFRQYLREYEEGGVGQTKQTKGTQPILFGTELAIAQFVTKADLGPAFPMVPRRFRLRAGHMGTIAKPKE